MRYLVYKWDRDDIESYNETYGEEAFYEDIERSSCFSSLSQYGTLVKETDSEEEANKYCEKASEDGYDTEASIWDFEEKYWFN